MKIAQNLFAKSDYELTKRSKASLDSIKAGRTRSIKSFKQEIDTWKTNKFHERNSI